MFAVSILIGAEPLWAVLNVEYTYLNTKLPVKAERSPVKVRR